MSNINQNKIEGCFQISRSIYNSEIWSKPDWYLKVWLYLIGKANHKDVGNFKRGEYFLKGGYRELQGILTKRGGYGKKKTEKYAISRCMSYMVSAQLISIRKTTVGMYVKILNYNDYQDIANYETQPEEKRRRNSNVTVMQLNASSINKNERMKERITTEKSVVENKKSSKESRTNSPNLLKDLFKLKDIKVTKEGPKTTQWQNLAVLWTEKFGLNEKDEVVLFKLFKGSKSNGYEIERLCSLALEAKAKNPIGYILWKKKQEKDQKITIKT